MSRRFRFHLGIIIILGGYFTFTVAATASSQPDTAHVRFIVVDKATNVPVPCRIHLKDSESKSQLFSHLPSFRDHFCFDGDEVLTLAPGKYTYVIERGPEYKRVQGAFTARTSTRIEVNKTLERIANLAAAGYWSGDLHVHRSPKDIELLMKAEDLHVAPVITWWNAKNSWKKTQLPSDPLRRFEGAYFSRVLAGEDERNGGAFMYFNLSRPVDITRAKKEYPCPIYFIEQALQQPNAWIDIEKPFWWDVPVALAHGYGDSIGLANNHCWRSQMLDNEAWGKPRDRTKYASPHGNGLWSQEIYYHILNTGIRIPPSAGSASGVLTNPVGYNRVYVYTGSDKLDYNEWWNTLKKGRCFVTNGPLLRVDAAGKMPGHVFQQPGGRSLTLKPNLRIESNDPIARIEIIKNGTVERILDSHEFRERGNIGVVRIERSGWFLVRVIAEVDNTFRFASTAPYYVEIGENKRILSRQSIRFFLQWVEERIARIKITDKKEYQQVIKYHLKAKEFWQAKLTQANTE